MRAFAYLGRYGLPQAVSWSHAHLDGQVVACLAMSLSFIAQMLLMKPVDVGSVLASKFQ